MALSRSTEQAQRLRQQGVIPIFGELDSSMSLKRFAGLANYVLYTAPPPNQGIDDPRSKRLIAALTKGEILPRSLCYISTTGVYGDCGGAKIDETRAVAAESGRAQRRVNAEQHWRSFGHRTGTKISLLRAPGIYAADRLPIDRIRAGTPALTQADDSYSNHIHADDLAMACCLALFRGKANRTYNVCDNSDLKMGDWFDMVADALGQARPPRLDREAVLETVSPALWSFMRESRRIDNRRLLRELRLRLRYTTPQRLLDYLRNS